MMVRTFGRVNYPALERMKTRYPPVTLHMAWCSTPPYGSTTWCWKKRLILRPEGFSETLGVWMTGRG